MGNPKVILMIVLICVFPGKGYSAESFLSQILHYEASAVNLKEKYPDAYQTLYQKVKAIKPNLIVSWAPSIYPWAYDEYLQDWPSWLNGGYADLVIPQCYRYELAAYQSTLDEMIPDFLRIAPSDKIIFPGILMNVGDYVMSEDYLMKTMDYNRKKGYQGEVFFFYEGLRKNNDRLAKALLKNFYQQPAKLPWNTH